MIFYGGGSLAFLLLLVKAKALPLAEKETICGIIS